MISNCISKKLFHLFKKTRLIASFSDSKKAYTKGAQPNNLINLSIGQIFEQITEQYPNNIFINSYSQKTSFTYQKTYEVALSLATGLIKQLGLKPKDRIGVYSYNKWQWVIIQLAAAMADLILVNINPAYQSQELAYTIGKVGLKVIFLTDAYKKSNYLQIIKKIIPQIEKQVNQGEIRSSKFPFLKAVVRFNEAQQTERGFINFSNLLVLNDRSCLPKWPNCQDPTNIQFTSGTTGLPKAATLSHYNILNNGYQIGNRLNYSSNDNIVLPVPFYHCFGMVMGTLAVLTRGAGLTIVAEGFDPQKSLEAAEKYKSTGIYGVPTMFIEYLRILEQSQQKRYQLPNLRKGIVAGSLCSQPLMNKIINKLGLIEITNCYGMTQTAPVSFQTSPSDSMIKKTTTVGRILEGLEAKIVNQNSETVNVGEPGQFWTKGWHVMNEYWNDKKATENSIEDGWMKSGDLAALDDEGYLSIMGRKKDMIIRGGENIYPKQIEDFLFKIEGLQDVQVLGVPDQKFGEQIVAVIKVKSLKHNKITAKQILNHCKGNIAYYKIPKYVKFVTEYPLTVSGKVQKYIIKEQFEEEIKKENHIQYIIR